MRLQATLPVAEVTKLKRQTLASSATRAWVGLWGGKTAVVASLTHLRIDRDHPLAERVQAYQLRRSRLLGSPIARSSRRARAKLAAKQKRKRKARR